MNLSESLVLALDFANPWLLTGLVGASIPVVIHLLSKRRYKESPWAAMRFLAEAARKHTRRLRWEQLLLLLIRCLVIGFLALAFSRPFFETEQTTASGRDPRHYILMIDDSFSMGLKAGTKTRLDRALELARQAIDESASGDAFSLLTLTKSTDGELLEPTFRADSIRSQLDKVILTERTVNLAGTMTQLENLLVTAKFPEQKEVVLISDFQSRDWPVEKESSIRSQIQEILKRIAQDKLSFSLISVGREDEFNAAIKNVEIEPRPLLVGQTSKIAVTVETFGTRPEGGLSVDLEIDGKVLGSRTIEDSASPISRLEFEHTWSMAGPHAVVCRLREDPLPVDNTYFVGVDVRDSIRVLMVEGRITQPERQRSSHYIGRALETVEGTASGNPMFRVTVVDELTFGDVNLDEYDVVALCNLPTFPDTASRKLIPHLQRGGGVFLCLGDLTQPAGWNTGLARQFPDRVPFELLNSDGNDAEESAWGFLANQLEHPVVDAFQGNPGTGLESTITWDRRELKIKDDSTIVPVLRFDDDSPAIFDWKQSAGRVVVSRMSFDALAGSWAPLSGSFPPVAIRLFQFLAGSDDGAAEVLVGQPLSGQWNSRYWAGGAILKTPAGAEAELDIDADQTGNTSATWSFTETDRAGIYELSTGGVGEYRRFYAVNVDRTESDLAGRETQSLRQSDFASIVGVRQSAGTRFGSSENLLPMRESVLIAVLLLLAGVMAVTEVVMAWNFQVGLACLGGFALLGILFWASQWNEPRTVFSAGILVAALATVAVVRRTQLKVKTSK